MKPKLQATWPLPKPTEFSGVTRPLRDAICREVQQACCQELGSSLQAIVLTGSLARDEATFIKQGDIWKLLGDAESFVILNELTPLPSPFRLDGLRRRIKAGLLDQGIQAAVELCAVHATYFRKLKPHIFAYELRTCGQVLWGNSEILALIPAFSPADIPLEDAWRLLCNRMIEQLEAATTLLERPRILPIDTFYRTVKLYLDMATSYLVFVGAYELSYQRRAKRLMSLASGGQAQDCCPFPLTKFAERVSDCTEIKLNRSSRQGSPALEAANELGFSFWEEAIEYAQLLWRWELTILTGTKEQHLNGKLLQRWMRLQPRHLRLRGWLYAMRKQGWHRNWRNWPRWCRLAWQASPRYWVYAAASEVFFRLPCLMRSADKRPRINADWRAVRSWLPVTPGAGPGTQLADWQVVAAEVVWNYKQFLTGTRS